LSGRAGSLRTARLEIVPGSIAHYEDELASPGRLGARLGAHVPPGWPPGEHDRDAIAFFLARECEEGPSVAGWCAWYIVLRGEGGAPDELAGSIGYFGPPKDGVAEIGYSVVEGFRRRGIASEAIAAIARRAFATPGVTRVIAQTREDNPASQGALRRAGFHAAGPGAEPGMLRFETPAADGVSPA
jgi:RimJ/RimL family protein N-acetyltransferase